MNVKMLGISYDAYFESFVSLNLQELEIQNGSLSPPSAFRREWLCGY